MPFRGRGLGGLLPLSDLLELAHNLADLMPGDVLLGFEECILRHAATILVIIPMHSARNS